MPNEASRRTSCTLGYVAHDERAMDSLSLILVPALADWSALSATIYVAIAFVYFGELRKHMLPGRGTLSLTSIFVVGFATERSASVTRRW